MSKKSVDKKNRWRKKTVSFRMSDAEDKQLEKLVELSGLTKQEYLIQCMLSHSVVVNGNHRVFSKLEDYFQQILESIAALQCINDLSDEQAELLAIALDMYAKLNSEDKETK